MQDERAREQWDSSKASNVSITNQVNTLKNEIQDKDDLINSLNDQVLVQKTTFKESQLEKEQLERENKEFVELIKELKSDTVIIDDLQHKILSLERELLEAKENVKNERKVTEGLKENEESHLKTEEENGKVIEDLTQECKSNANVVEALKSEIDSLRIDLETSQQSLKEKTELEQRHLKSLHENETVLEENSAIMSRNEKLEEEIELLKCKLEEKNQGLDAELEQLTGDLQLHKQLNEELKRLKQDSDELLSSKEMELEKCNCEKESLGKELESSKELLQEHHTKTEDIGKLTAEKNSMEQKLSELEAIVSTTREDKAKLVSQLEEAEKHLETLKGKYFSVQYLIYLSFYET